MAWHQIIYRTYVCRCQLFLPALLSALLLVETWSSLVPDGVSGNRAFSVAGPAAWNSLPPDICTASTLGSFKNLLKTHSILSFISIINLISRSVCCTAPCSDFMDMLQRLISRRIIILILIVVRTYPRVCPRRCGTRCRGKAAAYAAKPQATRRSRGLASCRGKAARGEAAKPRII